MFRFTLRDVFWLTLLVALLLAWWREGMNLDSEKRALENEVRNAATTRDAALTTVRTTDPYFVAAGWRVFAEPDAYELGLDSKVRHGGEHSAFIKAKGSFDGSGAFLVQTLRADEYRGKRIRLSGQSKTDNVKPLGEVFIAAKRSYEASFYTCCFEYVPVSAGWRRYDLVLDIPGDAALITFGIFARERNTWIDDLQLEVVGADVPNSGKQSVHLTLLGRLVQSQSPGNLAITTMPLSLDFELPVPSQRTAKAGD